MSQHARAATRQTPAPVIVRWAASLLAAYSLMVLVYVLTLPPGASEFAHALVATSIARILGSAVMVWGVARGLPWGRWVTLAVGGLWAAFNALALLEYSAVPRVAPMQTLYFGPAGIMSLLLLCGAIGCLLFPQSRSWFRRGAV